jgi:hypothetical protein
MHGELKGRNMKTLVKSFALSAVLIAVSAGAAEAAPIAISWADFSATHRECQVQCTQHEWVDQIYCWTDGEDQYCEDEWELVCTATNNVCGSVRTLLPDGDLIDVSIQHNATDPSGIEFKLALGPGITWWKQLMGSGGSDQWTVWNWDDGLHCNWPQPITPQCDTNSEWTSVLLSEQGRFVFSKAKFLGLHTEMYELRNLASQLRGGDRVTFTWIRD